MDNLQWPIDKKIILFDGVCNLCNSSVQKIIALDKNDSFYFCSNQSEIGIKIIKYLGIDTSKTDSIILYEPNKAYYIKSQAIFEICKTLGGFYSLLSAFSVIPAHFNNSIYDLIAKNRYKWFGKKESCMIPTTELRGKFLL